MSPALQRAQLSRLPGGIAETLPRRCMSASNARPWLQRRMISVGELDSRRDGRERVVVLGSGWAGYTVARKLDASKFQAVVVSPRSYFVFTPLLASTAVGTLEFRTALEPVRSRRSGVVFFQGWADGVDFNKKEITIEEAVDDPNQGLALTRDCYIEESPGERRREKRIKSEKGQLFKVKYDRLVIAVGCYSQTFNTPGVRENALFLKDVGDARKIRKRLLACFEMAALPTTSDEMKKRLLKFVVVGGGPTGIEFSAEMHDIIKEDLAKLYPELTPYYSIAVYDVAPKVLSMFDEKLAKYATDTFAREGIEIKTSHHVQELRRGFPGPESDNQFIENPLTCFTLKVKEEGELGVGMVVWSTGLMMNPFVEHALNKVQPLPNACKQHDKPKAEEAKHLHWLVRKDPKTGSIVTDEHLRVTLEPEDSGTTRPQETLPNVYALGDCAMVEGTAYPATAQVASQKAEWLATRLNKGDLEAKSFKWNNAGVMAYIGSWNAIMQSGGGENISGRTAWLIWRGAYLVKSISWRNRLLIPIYWFINWAERKPKTPNETPETSSSRETLADLPTNVVAKRRSSTVSARTKKPKQQSEERTRQSSRPTSPNWEDVDKERPRRKSKSSSTIKSDYSSRRIRTTQFNQSGAVREEVEGIREDGTGFFPKLSKILEHKEAQPASRRSSGSVVSTSDRGLYSVRSHRGGAQESSGVAERRAIRHRQRSQQRRAELLMNPSTLSVLSGTTNSSGTSSGSGSTITQKSYDRSGGEKRRPSNEQGRWSADTHETHDKSPGIKLEDKSAMDRSNVFSFMVPDVPEAVNVEGSRASSSSSAYAGSDAGSAHTTASSVTSSSSPSPTMARTRLIRDEWYAHEMATSDGNTSARGSSSERSHRNRQRQRHSGLRSRTDADQKLSRASDLGKEKEVPVSSEKPPHEDRAEYLKQQYDQALQHQRLHGQGAMRGYYQHAQSHPRFAATRSHDEYGDASSSYDNTPPPAPEPPSQQPQNMMSYKRPLSEQNARSDPARSFIAPPDPNQTTVVGYEALASKLSSTDHPPSPGSSLRPLYRKFEQLNHRLLLHLQDEIAELEEELRRLDECIAQATAKAAGKDISLPASRRAEAQAGTNTHHRRVELLGRIYMKMSQYNSALSAFQSVVQNSAPAGPADIDAYHAYLAHDRPLVEIESRFLRNPADLIQVPARPPSATTSSAATGTGTQEAALTRLAPVAILGAPLALVIVPLAAFSVVGGLWGRLWVLVVIVGGAAALLAHGMTTGRVVGWEAAVEGSGGREWMVAGAVYVLPLDTSIALVVYGWFHKAPQLMWDV
ncbi:MAG: hypothetical protein M1821_002152 [Bathelium mastoideum]|nr:MAG: hypothetical protein M1821_002152 [Bathelium mastoideum]